MAAQETIVRHVVRIPGSFRDPAGHVYTDNGQLFRTVNSAYAPHYEYLQSSGLLADLSAKGWMIDFEEDRVSRVATAWKTIRVRRIPFISYPYEWSFSQLRAAALLTLDIQEAALEKGMTLKDASAYNIQFEGTRPICIDCLSLEILENGAPWVAYGQFCRHFLAPLVLAAWVHVDTLLMLRDYIDGVPLNVASAMLPLRTRLYPGIQLHIHVHQRLQRRHGDGRRASEKVRRLKVDRSTLQRLVQSLRALIQRLKPPSVATNWGSYYDDTNYSPEAFEAKRLNVSALLDRIAPTTLLDLGANRGAFSSLPGPRRGLVIAADMDPLAVERHYQDLILEKKEGTLPLVIDLSNPSPSIGWLNEERSSFLERCNVDAVLALALIHHLTIANNVPLEMSARLFAALGRHLLLEFVPKEDSQVQRMLASRKDIFSDYRLDALQTAYAPYFTCIERRDIPGSMRTLLLFERRG